MIYYENFSQHRWFSHNKNESYWTEFDPKNINQITCGKVVELAQVFIYLKDN